MKGIPLGFAVGTGKPVGIPLRHLAVVGQTQESGKTTTLEALILRAGVRAIVFVTKRGETAFAGARRIPPYFRDRADWQFVDQILEAQLHEKNKFLRPWIIRICRTTKTLADVQREVKAALRGARGIHEGVYTQLDAYLELIVPEIGRARLADRIHLEPGLNVMDVAAYPTPMQMLFVQSALEWVNAHEHDVVTVIPEAWEFVPEGKGSPVKASAIALVRKGGALRNYLWIDSQDTAGVDKTLLRGCSVWLLGVQREANEIKRNLANIPASVRRPPAAAVATLRRGQFYVCYETETIKTYVRPAWMDVAQARAIAQHYPTDMRPVRPREMPVNETEATALRNENADLRRRVDELEHELKVLREFNAIPRPRPPAGSGMAVIRPAAPAPAASTAVLTGLPTDGEAMYAFIKSRLLADADVEAALVKVAANRPVLEVTVSRPLIEATDATLFGRLAALLAEGFFDEGRTGSAAYTELQRRGVSTAKPNVYREADKLATLGFLTKEADGGYRAVKTAKIRVVESRT